MKAKNYKIKFNKNGGGVIVQGEFKLKFNSIRNNIKWLTSKQKNNELEVTQYEMCNISVVDGFLTWEGESE